MVQKMVSYRESPKLLMESAVLVRWCRGIMFLSSTTQVPTKISGRTKMMRKRSCFSTTNLEYSLLPGEDSFLRRAGGEMRHQMEEEHSLMRSALIKPALAQVQVSEEHSAGAGFLLKEDFIKSFEEGFCSPRRTKQPFSSEGQEIKNVSSSVGQDAGPPLTPRNAPILDCHSDSSESSVPNRNQPPKHASDSEASTFYESDRDHLLRWPYPRGRDEEEPILRVAHDPERDHKFRRCWRAWAGAVIPAHVKVDDRFPNGEHVYYNLSADKHLDKFQEEVSWGRWHKWLSKLTHRRVDQFVKRFPRRLRSPRCKGRRGRLTGGVMDERWDESRQTWLKHEVPGWAKIDLINGQKMYDRGELDDLGRHVQNKVERAELAKERAEWRKRKGKRKGPVTWKTYNTMMEYAMMDQEMHNVGMEELHNCRKNGGMNGVYRKQRKKNGKRMFRLADDGGFERDRIRAILKRWKKFKNARDVSRFGEKWTKKRNKDKRFKTIIENHRLKKALAKEKAAARRAAVAKLLPGYKPKVHPKGHPKPNPVAPKRKRKPKTYSGLLLRRRTKPEDIDEPPVLSAKQKAKAAKAKAKPKAKQNPLFYPNKAKMDKRRRMDALRLEHYQPTIGNAGGSSSGSCSYRGTIKITPRLTPRHTPQLHVISSRLTTPHNSNSTRLLVKRL